MNSSNFNNNNNQAPKAPEVPVEPNWRLPTWFPNLSTEILSQLKTFLTELEKFNKVINLISPKTMANADAIHFADSVYSSEIVHKYINKNNTLYDLGSGNGFPGLVYGILYKDQKVILMDSDQRKCEFLKHVITALSLTNVTVENTKIDTLADNSIEQAICRGFAPIPRLLLMMRRIVTSTGVIYNLKSEEWAVEVSQIPTQLCSVWQPKLLGDYKIPVLDTKLYVVETAKIT